MKIIVQNGEVYTRSLGTGRNALLIIHGGPDWDHSYLLNAAEILARDTRVILFDIRGCGLSSRFDNVEEYSINKIVSDIQTVLSAHRLKSCGVLGFSFGGTVALSLLKQHPDMIERLILAPTTAYASYQADLEAKPEYQKRNTPELRTLKAYAFHEAEPIGEEPSRSLAMKSLALDVHDLSKLGVVKKVISKIKFSSEWIKAFRKGVIGSENFDVAYLINSTNKQLLIVHGQNDLRFPLSVAQKLHQNVPASELVVINGAGHLAHLEKLNEWVNAVGTFLAKKAHEREAST